MSKADCSRFHLANRSPLPSIARLRNNANRIVHRAERQETNGCAKDNESAAGFPIGYLKRSIRTKLFGSVFAFVLLSAIVVALLAANVVRTSMQPQIGMQHELLVRGVADVVSPAISGDSAALRQRILIVPSLTKHFWNVGVIDRQARQCAHQCPRHNLTQCEH
ncbi:hypothetical protein ACN9MY_20970 [Pseudoduganella sp. R-31]|uniref:hypothetical protein n=1 Tax=Pseudoduganella sp. R-31 TaxID=3404060 RepID=UPI003CEC9782